MGLKDETLNFELGYPPFTRQTRPTRPKPHFTEEFLTPTRPVSRPIGTGRTDHHWRDVDIVRFCRP
jgi:hypothetical protein